MWPFHRKTDEPAASQPGSGAVQPVTVGDMLADSSAAVRLLQDREDVAWPTIRRMEGYEFDGTDVLDYQWSFGGNTYMGVPGIGGARTERIDTNFNGMVVGAYKRNGVIFACVRARTSVFSEGVFSFQRLRNGRPGDYFGNPSLRILDEPWPGGTTQDLLTRMLQDADLAGNSFWTVRNGQLKRLRPDWVTIVMGSMDNPDIRPEDLDAELLGYGYFPGGVFTGPDSNPIYLAADEVAHFAPTPDPMAYYRGMSWITPIIRELQADDAASLHKLAFFKNGATLQTVVSFKDMKQETFERFMKKMDNAHKGAHNAYRTLFLGGGADVNVIGANLRDLDFKTVQGAGETRIAAAAGVHPVIVGLSEGLQGASLNAGNFSQARRQFAEGTLSTLWRNAAASLAVLVPPPDRGARLVVDTRDIPFLRQDQTDAAAIMQAQSSTISSLIMSGYTPDSAVAAIVAQDWTLLEHTGLYSVQLQPPGVATMGSPDETKPASIAPAPTGNASTPSRPASTGKQPPTAAKPTKALIPASTK